MEPTHPTEGNIRLRCGTESSGQIGRTTRNRAVSAASLSFFSPASPSHRPAVASPSHRHRRWPLPPIATGGQLPLRRALPRPLPLRRRRLVGSVAAAGARLGGGGWCEAQRGRRLVRGSAGAAASARLSEGGGWCEAQRGRWLVRGSAATVGRRGMFHSIPLPTEQKCNRPIPRIFTNRTQGRNHSMP
jgi:hypothetical protein